MKITAKATSLTAEFKAWLEEQKETDLAKLAEMARARGFSTECQDWLAAQVAK